jgi:hypothetical protein
VEQCPGGLVKVVSLPHRSQINGIFTIWPPSSFGPVLTHNQGKTPGNGKGTDMN